MLAMALTRPGQGRVERRELPTPVPAPGEVLLRVSACGVCRTDLHLVDGELPLPHVPLVPGHEMVGRITAVGSAVTHLDIGMRVGVPWLGGVCGSCVYCASGQENLCRDARFTGCHRDGGYAEYAAADARFAFPLPDAYDDVHAAPLLCAGLIGHRAYRMTGSGRRLGVYGFGAAAHSGAGRPARRSRCLRLRATRRRRGGQLRADSAPRGRVARTRHRRNRSMRRSSSRPSARWCPKPCRGAPGGVVVCAGIHMSDITGLPVSTALGRTRRALSREPHAGRRPGFPRHRSQRLHPDADAHVPPRASQRRARRFARGRLSGAAVLCP